MRTLCDADSKYKTTWQEHQKRNYVLLPPRDNELIYDELSHAYE